MAKKKMRPIVKKWEDDEELPWIEVGEAFRLYSAEHDKYIYASVIREDHQLVLRSLMEAKDVLREVGKRKRKKD